MSYLGFSAETGELSDNFDIISVETKNLYGVQPPASEITKKPVNTKKLKTKKPIKSSDSTTRESGGWTWFFVKLFVFFGLIAGIYGGYTIWRMSSKKGSRFD